MMLIATELMTLLVVWLIGRLWLVESRTGQRLWTIVAAAAVGAILAWIATDPHGAHEQALELICGGALGLLLTMKSRLGTTRER